MTRKRKICVNCGHSRYRKFLRKGWGGELYCKDHNRGRCY